MSSAKAMRGKGSLARRLRRETTVSKRWIAQQLSMGSVSNVTFCLRAGGNDDNQLFGLTPFRSQELTLS